MTVEQTVAPYRLQPRRRDCKRLVNGDVRDDRAMTKREKHLLRGLLAVVLLVIVDVVWVFWPAPKEVPAKERVPEPSGNFVIEGNLAINDVPLTDIDVSYDYKWARWPNQRTLRMRTGTNGLFSFSHLADTGLSGRFNWSQRSGHREIIVSRYGTVPSLTNLSFNIIASAKITAVISAPPASSSTNRVVSLFRSRPGLPTAPDALRDHLRRSRDVTPPDFELRDHAMLPVLPTGGVVSFAKLPVGEYVLYGPPVRGRGPQYPELFPPQLIVLKDGDARSVKIVCP